MTFLCAVVLAAETAFGVMSSTSSFAFAARVTIIAVTATLLIREMIQLKPDETISAWLINLILSIYALILCIGVIGAFEFLYRPTEIKQTAVAARVVVYSPAIVFLSWVICTLCDQLENRVASRSSDSDTKSSDNNP